ncbi:hypothetical protein BDV24DRAFT_159966 [Aspergillus arachidicola]|uniref:F-box domain-containing protein n=1 Tax=Aspergillus arachidicola TaxID=656916 RepID=A0A5N6YI27_9EURO|nr:hypothetical protein BDV24DRAFT_159966 [Aspergillus arachidicola]
MSDPSLMLSWERSRLSTLPKNELYRLSDASRIFSIPEILEAILLSLDMHTLLISSRVCCTWNNLIKSSRKIQQALFYIPVDVVGPGQPPIKNPLVVERIWVESIRAQLPSRPRISKQLCGRLGGIPYILSEKKEQAYLRPEASWRLMLVQQAPNSIVRIWNPEMPPDRPYSHRPGMFDTHAKWTPNRDYIRLEIVQYWVDAGTFAPSPLPFLFWVDPMRMRKVRSRKRLARNTLLTQYVAQFDFTINTDCYGWMGFSPGVDDGNPIKQAWFPEWCKDRDVTLLGGSHSKLVILCPTLSVDCSGKQCIKGTFATKFDWPHGSFYNIYTGTMPNNWLYDPNFTKHNAHEESDPRGDWTSAEATIQYSMSLMCRDWPLSHLNVIKEYYTMLVKN